MTAPKKVRNIREYIIEGLCEDKNPAQAIDCLIADLQGLALGMVEMSTAFNALRNATNTKNAELDFVIESEVDDLR